MVDHAAAVKVFGHFHEREMPTNHNALRPANDEHLLVQPKKLVNPVVESKDHRNLNRELKINNKLGIDVLNQKSELSKVFAERSREKKNSPLRNPPPPKSEFELMMEKRRKDVEVVEEKKIEEENVPEFIKLQRKLRKNSCEEENT